MSTPISLLPGTLPYDCYPEFPQQLNVDIVTRIVAFLDQNFPGVYVGTTEPPANQRDRVWFHTGSTRWYYFISGAWQRVFDEPSGSKKLFAYCGTVTDLNTEDGGSAGAVGPSTGPLWVVDSTMTGRTHIGAGLIPGSDPAVTPVVGDTGGAGSVALDDIKKIPYHGHNLPQTTDAPDTPAGPWVNLPAFRSGGSNWRTPSDSLTLGFVQFKWEGGDPANANKAVAHDNMPPYKAGLWIRRSARVYVSPPY